MKDQALINAYRDVLGTVAGQEVFKDLLTKFAVTVPVYAFGQNNNIADISYRDGQRNCGIYIYNKMALADPVLTSSIYADVIYKDNEIYLKSQKGE